MTDRHLLTNGRYRTLVTSTGGGGSAIGTLDLTRWYEDATREMPGISAYLRDLDSGAYWSATFQPVPLPGMTCSTTAAPHSITLARRDGTIETTTEIVVSGVHDLERRRYRISNHGAEVRRIELTTYAEVVLNTPAADAGHPAFSKLFVQTDYLAGAETVLAHRRLRSPEDEPLWFGHALRVVDADVAGGGLEMETDRARFIGRGRSLANPVALTERKSLSGTSGNVLDPVMALRRVCAIPPGGTAVFDALYAAGAEQADVESALAAASDEDAFASAPREPGVGAATLMVPAPPVGSRYAPAAGIAEPAPRRDVLQFDNGYGGFSGDGTEYVIRMDRTPDDVRLPPAPWTNVIANAAAGCVVSERGLGFTWASNSRENRLTPWFNDPVSDPVGEAIYIRDEDSGIYWSPTPAPVAGAGAYTCSHGFGYTRWEHQSQMLAQDVTCFVAVEDPVKLVRLRLTNRSRHRRSLSLFYYAELVLGSVRTTTVRSIATESAEGGRVLLARNPARPDFAAAVAFAAVSGPGTDALSYTADRGAFLGACCPIESPAALSHTGALDGKTGAGLDPCAAFQLAVTLEPGETAEWTFALGEAPDSAAAREIAQRFNVVFAVERELAVSTAKWRDLTSAVKISTPVPALDLMANGWLAYQNLSCRIWARSAMYQSGGAFGYRDQLQDATSLVYHDPALARAQILLHAANQFVEGDVLHWWHPPAGRGIRTRFADDLLWLPLLTQYYVDTTGDHSVYDEECRFLSARLLRPGEDEVFLAPHDSLTSGSVYEHCCRAIDRSLGGGAHGLPLIGTGDWNDGMNRVGRLGEGESVWMGFFLHTILERFLATCQARGDTARVARYRARMDSLHEALNAGGWDSAWYRRAYYDDGTPLGSAASDECRIDAIAQAWSVISGVASVPRATQALDAMEAWLVDEPAGIIRLLTPPFDKTPHDPGYIKGYLPGVRENGGQYTHAALWAVKALAEFGRGDRAAELLEMLSPATRGGSVEAIATYLVEPYVVAADVYGVDPHTGRGGWTWYTGSAGWMLRVIIESVLGLGLVEGTTLRILPALPLSWPEFTIRYRVPRHGGALVLTVRRVTGVSAVRSGALASSIRDGAVFVALPEDATTHTVEVEIGPELVSCYRPSTAPSERMTSE
ncbi:MAG: glycosyl transferase [Gemmatimonadota bacterium]